LRNILVVEIGNTNIKQNIQQKRKVEQRKVFAISSIAHLVLYVRLNHQYPERLYKQVQEKENNEVGDETSLHGID
jgi:type III secretion system FlhB-like substrate exporter